MCEPVRERRGRHDEDPSPRPRPEMNSSEDWARSFSPASLFSFQIRTSPDRAIQGSIAAHILSRHSCAVGSSGCRRAGAPFRSIRSSRGPERTGGRFALQVCALAHQGVQSALANGDAVRDDSDSDPNGLDAATDLV